VVLDASSLYRNLFFLLQILELDTKVVVALNQYDLLERDGYEIDTNKLEELLKVKVVKTVATKNIGIKELFEVALEEVHKSYKRVFWITVKR